MLPAPDYEELADALDAAGVELSAAEVHGRIVGAASFPQAPHVAEVLFGQADVALRAPMQALLPLLQALQADVERRLESIDFDFEPMLGQAQLPAQIERLAAWSRGYVLGLAAGGLRDPNRLTADAGEFLLDAMRIGEAQMDEDSDREQQEREIAEIVEYLRVGTQIVYEELHGGRASDE